MESSVLEQALYDVGDIASAPSRVPLHPTLRKRHARSRGALRWCHADARCDGALKRAPPRVITGSAAGGAGLPPPLPLHAAR